MKVYTLAICLLAGLQLGLPNQGIAKSATVDSLVSLADIHRGIREGSANSLLGKKVTVSGIANISTGVLHQRYLQVYIQSDSAGLSLFNKAFDKPISVGDSVVARGMVQQYGKLTEVQVEEYEVFPDSRDSIKAMPLKEAIDRPERYEGMLVAGVGVIQSRGKGYNGKYVVIAPTDTSAQSMMVYVSNFHRHYDEFDFSQLSVGDRIRVKGILSQYQMSSFPSDDIFKVMLRSPSDLQYDSILKRYQWLALFFLAAVSILVLGWILMLKRQVGKQTEIIKSSLKEKELLLQEIHHRVKNNLAIISGLIELQLDNTSDEAAHRVLKDSQVRIHSMAMVHEKLYKSATLSSVKMDSYIRELVEGIHQTFINSRRDINIEYKLEPIKLGIEQVIPCGLLINELVVNAFKHAFGEDKQGRLFIGFRQNDDEYELTITDNGSGISEEQQLEQSDSLGMMLIKTFASQLSADMEVRCDGGTSFTFRFKIS